MIRILALLLLFSCSSNKKKEYVVPEITPANVVESGPIHAPSIPIGPEYPVANVKRIFTVVIKDTNYTRAQKERLREVEKLIAEIFNSVEFKEEILKRKYTNDLGLTSAEIYEKLFQGAEALQPAVNYQMDLKVEMYYKRFSKVVGYTYPNTLMVWTNSKFHSWYSACLIASNMVHEWSHKVGFGHSSASDWKSVPYSLNEIVEDLCTKKLTPISKK